MATTLDDDPVKQAILKAIRKGSSKRVVEIMAKNPQISGNECVDSAKNRLLHKAARYGQAEVILALIDTCNADPNATNKFEMTPLHHAAVEGSAAAIETLINAGADCNLADNSKRLPLHWTCANGFLEASRALLENGKSKVNVADKEGFSPLLRACQEPPMPKKNESGEILEPSDEEKEIHDAQRAEIVKLLVANNANVNAREPMGNQSALHLAAINGYAQVCKELMSSGADPNAVNKISKSPLMYAASENKVKCLKVLAESGTVDLEMVDVIHNQWNALHYAVLEDNVEAVKILVNAGADLSKRDGIGRTAIVIAGDHTKTKVLVFLESLSK